MGRAGRGGTGRLLSVPPTDWHSRASGDPAGKRSHSVSTVEPDLGPEGLDLGRREQRGVVERVARDREAPALDGVGEHDARAGRLRVAGAVGVGEDLEVVAAEVLHQRGEVVVGARRPRWPPRRGSAPARNRSRSSAPRNAKSDWYSSFDMSSMWRRRCWPPGRAKASCSRCPYFASTTCQPESAKNFISLWTFIPGMTRSRLWRLTSMIQVTLPRPCSAGSAMASQMLPSSSSASPTRAMKRAGRCGPKWAST